MKLDCKSKVWLWLSLWCCALPAVARRGGGFSQPEWLGSSTELVRITKVEFTDTATIVSFHERYKPGWWIQMAKEAVLRGEDGREYKALRGEGIVLGEHYVTPPSGEGEFKVLFEPMPRKTRFFDFIEGNMSGAFNIYGVHEEGKGPEVPEGQAPFVMTPELERQFFAADSACVRGRIEGYSRSQGYSTMLFNRTEAMTDERLPLAVEVREDGTFEFRFWASHPQEGTLMIEGKDAKRFVNFYAVPGQATGIVVRADGSVSYAAVPSGPFGCKSLLESGVSGLCAYPYDEFSADADSLDFKGFAENAMRRMREQLRLVDYVAWRFGYTPWERHLAECQARMVHGMAVLDYEMNKRLASYQEAKSWEEIEAKLASYSDPANYRFLREMPCNDVSALVLRDFYLFLNRYRFSSALRKPDMLVRVLKPDSVAKGDAAQMTADMEIFGADEPSLFGRLVLLHDLSFILESNYGDAPSMYDSIYQNRLAYMDREALQVQAKRMLEKARRRNTLTYALPDTEGGKLLRRLTGKYKGKYVMIDFWGMFCGPCRAGIERSKPMREALRNHPDVDFLFVSVEGEGPEGNYRKYVGENLSGEDVVQVSRDDFNRLMELFNFLGIPHYETLDRNGNVVRDGLHYEADADAFKAQLDRMKKTLEP